MQIYTKVKSVMKPQIPISFQNGQLVVTLTCSSSWPAPRCWPTGVPCVQNKEQDRDGASRSLLTQLYPSSSLLSCAIFLN